MMKKNPPYYKNAENGVIYAYTPRLTEDPNMVPFWGKLPKINKDTGIVQIIDEDSAPTPAVDAPEETEPEEVVEEDKPSRMDILVEAIGRLKIKDFNTAGLPNVYALQKVSKLKEVNAMERNEAHGIFKANEKAAEGEE